MYTAVTTPATRSPMNVTIDRVIDAPVTGRSLPAGAAAGFVVLGAVVTVLVLTDGLGLALAVTDGLGEAVGQASGFSQVIGSP